MSGPLLARRDRGRTAAVLAVWLLAFASIVSWRKGVLYSGGADPVVIAKAAVALLAAVGAVVLWRTAPARRAVAPVPVLLVTAIVGVSLVGAIQASTLPANAVLTARIFLLGFTIVFLVATTSTPTLIATMLAAMGAIGVFAAATAWIPVALHLQAATRSRLGGGIPPLEPNELATLLLPPAIGLLALIARRGVRAWPTLGFLLVALIIYETGSRVALLMVIVAGAVLAVRERRLTPGVQMLMLAGALGAYVVLTFSSFLTEVTLRGQGTGRLVTLNSRTISWSVILDTPSSHWSWWVGNGLSMKSVEVLGQAWKSQVFDSSWISSIAQGGWIGTVLLALYVGGTLLFALRRSTIGPLLAALTITVVIRSFFENGLIESSAVFAVFFTLALSTWPGTGGLDRPLRVASAPAAAAPRVLRVPAWAEIAASTRS